MPAPYNLRSSMKRSSREEEPSAEKGKEELSVEKEEDELSILDIQKRRKEIVKQANERLKQREMSARQRKLPLGRPAGTRRPTFTPEEREAYKRRLEESRGFDVGYVPDNLDPRLTPVKPYKVFDRPDPDLRLKKVERYCKLAIKKFNKDNETKFEFGKFVKANVRRGYLGWYVTFESKDMPGSPPKRFQAIVHTNRFDEANVFECNCVA